MTKEERVQRLVNYAWLGGSIQERITKGKEDGQDVSALVTRLEGVCDQIAHAKQDVLRR